MEKLKDTEQHNLEDLQRLREAIEQKLGMRILNPKDFVYLSEYIAQHMHQTIGVNTLKRIWGQLDDNVTPRRSTLNLLAQFAGADSWDAFCQSNIVPSESAQPDAPNTTNAPEKEVHSYKWFFVIVMIMVVFGGIWGIRNYLSSNGEEPGEHKMLYQGQRFASYDDYLKLFGLVDVKEYPYYQIHPQYPHIVLWGPEYHNPHWHNDGDASQLLPTITERWEPADTIPELIVMRNQELYYNGRRNRDIRLTFMKGLNGDTDFVFLGAYRFSLTQSDTAHIVWERVADEADLLHLELLEQLRK